MHGGRPRVGGSVDDVDAVGGEAGQDEVATAAGDVVEAARAGVPPRVVQLVTGVGHHQAVYHLNTDQCDVVAREGSNM